MPPRFTAVCFFAAALLLLWPAGGLAPADLPIADDQLNVVFVKDRDGTLTKEQAAVIGSQNIEDLVEKELDGDYAAYFNNDPPESIDPKHRDAVAKMIASGELPQMCVSCGASGKFYLDPVPETEDEATEIIQRVGGQP